MAEFDVEANQIWAKKLINTLWPEKKFFSPNLAYLSIYLKTMIPLFLCNSASNFQRKSQKIENNNNQIFYFIFCIFLKNRRVELSFQCRNEFYMPKYPINRIFMRFGEKSVFLRIFALMAMCRLWAKKLIDTFRPNLESFHLKTMIPLFLCNSTSNFQRKSQKIENNNNQIFYFIFCIFLKNRSVQFSFQCRNEFYMPKYPNNCIFMGFGKKAFFLRILAMWRLWSQKIDQYLSAEFGVFPSQNHDSIVFMQFYE